MSKAINRTTEQMSDTNYRVYPKHLPKFYKKSDGSFEKIDKTFNDSTSTIGDINLL